MIEARRVVPALVVALAAGWAVPSHAASAGDAGPSVVVPFVPESQSTNVSHVFVENHESRAVDVQVRWVGERTTSSAGMRVCGTQRLGPGSLTRLDVTRLCRLSLMDDEGMVVLLATQRSGIARISARAVISTRSAGTLMVDGLPLASLESTDVVHVATGLATDPTGAVLPAFTTDCLLGTFFDGSGYGGALVSFGLRDGDGQPLGRDVVVAVPPFSLTRFPDVASLVGAPAGLAFDDVRAVFSLTGGGDAVVGYCVSTASTSNGPSGRTVTYSLAQVDDPLEGTRRRAVAVSSTPEVRGGAAFTIRPTETKVTHGLFVQHPDRLTCGVGSTASLDVKVVPPDGTLGIGGAGSTVIFDTGPRGTINGGRSGLWGLEVAWPSGVPGPAPADYTIFCRSGNGVSLTDELFRR